MDLPSRIKPSKKKEIKTLPVFFQFLLTVIRTKLRNHFALCLGKKKGPQLQAIYMDLSRNG
jgi:hypothetical protein